MRRIDGVRFDKTRISLDDTELQNCQVTNCEIVYSGGAFGWTNTKLSNCRLTLRGPAAMTTSFLEKFGLADTADQRWNAVTLEFPPSDETVN